MSMNPLALVTGGSTGIGRHLAQMAAEDGHDLLIVSDDAGVMDMDTLSATGAGIETVQADLSQQAGIDLLMQRLGSRVPDLFFANAGLGMGGAFVDGAPEQIRKVLETNVVSTTLLTHQILRLMVARGTGRIMLTGSIAGHLPGAYQAVYNATKAYVNTLSVGLRHELDDTEVTVTCLSPGLTDTEFFARADLLDTPLGQAPKDDPEMVARQGYKAMMAGKEEVVTGLKNKVMVAASHVLPKGLMAEQHGAIAKPKD